MTTSNINGLVREVVGNAQGQARVGGTVREVVLNPQAQLRSAKLVREVVMAAGSANTSAWVTGLVREVVMAGPPLGGAQVMAWRMGW